MRSYTNKTLLLGQTIGAVEMARICLFLVVNKQEKEKNVVIVITMVFVKFLYLDISVKSLNCDCACTNEHFRLIDTHIMTLDNYHIYLSIIL